MTVYFYWQKLCWLEPASGKQYKKVLVETFKKGKNLKILQVIDSKAEESVYLNLFAFGI